MISKVGLPNVPWFKLSRQRGESSRAKPFVIVPSMLTDAKDIEVVLQARERIGSAHEPMIEGDDGKTRSRLFDIAEVGIYHATMALPAA